MAELVANFTLNNESLDVQFDISPGANFDALFQIDGGAMWGGIRGNIQEQTDLIELLNEKINSIEGQGLINTTRVDDKVYITSTTYTHEQAIASDVWVINHDLNKCPSIYVVDTAGHMQMPDDITVNDMNTITVTFLSAFAGLAYLN